MFNLPFTFDFGIWKCEDYSSRGHAVFIWSYAFRLQVESDIKSGLAEVCSIIYSKDTQVCLRIVLSIFTSSPSEGCINPARLHWEAAVQKTNCAIGPIIRQAQQLLMCQCCCCCDAETDVSLWHTRASACAEKYICKQAVTWRFMPHIPNYFILLVVCIHQAVCLYCAPVGHVLPQTSLVWVWI